MIKIQNITSYHDQRHTITKSDGNVTIRLKYHDVIEQWTIDVSRNGKNVYGVKLSVGTVHIASQNMGIDFAVTDNLGLGIDPFKVDDFESGRCSLVMIDAV